MIQPTLEQQVWIEAPRQRVWAAITQTEQIKPAEFLNRVALPVPAIGACIERLPAIHGTPA